jgi:hypothetical protein
MTAEELKAIIAYLRERVHLGSQEAQQPPVIAFDAPMAEDMINVGLNSQGVKRILRVPWWDDMVIDIVETPEMCDEDDPPQQVLEYAKDVVSDYIRKRFPLNED